MRWYKLAEKEIGTKEIPGESDNPDIVEYFEEVGHSWVQDDETAWCAAFVGSMLERAGIPSTRALNARSYLEWGQPSELKEGSIVVLWRDKPDSWKGHVGFATGKETKDKIEILGGNQSNMVNKAMYPKERILDFREPAVVLPSKPKPEPSKKAAAPWWIIPVILAAAAIFWFFVVRS